eukprot:1373010-Alexandrium_andersonii.AAC.1
MEDMGAVPPPAMDLASLPPTLTPRDNPLDVILDFLLQWRATEAAGAGTLVPLARVFEECSRHGFSLEEAVYALETWRRLDLVRDSDGGTVSLRASQVPPSLPDAWAGATPP